MISAISSPRCADTPLGQAASETKNRLYSQRLTSAGEKAGELTRRLPRWTQRSCSEGGFDLNEVVHGLSYAVAPRDPGPDT